MVMFRAAVAAALASDVVTLDAEVKAITQIGRHFQMIAGSILALIGISMATGHLFSFGTWMLDTFPFSNEIQI